MQVLRISIHAVTWTATYAHIDKQVASEISIHAVTWTATPEYFYQAVTLPISIHAVTWDCDCTASATRRPPLNFNSRSHVDCDTSLGFISFLLRYFNSRSHVDCDINHLAALLLISGFQFTQSRGLRHFARSRPRHLTYFNSRSHVDCDLWDRLTATRPDYFNSRSHVDCDVCWSVGDYFDPDISIHAVTWTATALLSL